VGNDLYFYAGELISSAWSLGGLLSSTEAGVSDERTLVIDLLDAPPCEPSELEWVHHWPSEGCGMSLAISGEDASFLLRFSNLADFVISECGRQIRVWPALETGLETLNHLLLDQVLPRVLSQRGLLVLHAGAVRVGNHAIAFLGDTGSGKSTLTASFHAAGYSLLSDDGLAVKNEGLWALPTYPSLRLWPDAIASIYAQKAVVAPMAHYSSKRRIVMTDVAAEPLPLGALYVLESGAVTPDRSILLRRLTPGAACVTIIANSFQLDVTDLHHAADTLADAGRIAECVPVFSLAYPWDFARLPEVQEAILAQRSE